MFLGYTFCRDNTSHTEISSDLKTIRTADVKGVVVDELYMTKDSTLTTYDDDGTPTVAESIVDYVVPYQRYWDKNTVLHADFDQDIKAGNIKYDVDEVQAVKLKRRKHGDLKWQTIYEQEIDKSAENPFNFTFKDYLEPSNTDIDYCYTFVIDGNDYDSIFITERSDFSDFFIIGADIENNQVKNTVYHAIANVVNTPKYNRASNTIVCPGSKYPYVINNGIAQYYSGTFNAIFFPVLNCCEFDAENAWVFRNGLDKFLANGQAKLIKKFDGNIWLANIVGDITRSDGDHYQCEVQEFEWVECGDPWSAGDLYDNGFILTDTDREG